MRTMFAAGFAPAGPIAHGATPTEMRAPEPAAAREPQRLTTQTHKQAGDTSSLEACGSAQMRASQPRRTRGRGVLERRVRQCVRAELRRVDIRNGTGTAVGSGRRCGLVRDGFLVQHLQADGSTPARRRRSEAGARARAPGGVEMGGTCKGNAGDSVGG